YFSKWIAAIQGTFYAGSNCFHRRKVIYGSSPNDTITENIGYEDLHKIFGRSTELRDSAAQVLSGSNAKIEDQKTPSRLIEAAICVAGCKYEYSTSWGKEVGWLYGSATEDILTGLNIHGKGWKSVTLPHGTPLAFLGCAPYGTYPTSLTQMKRWGERAS
ncbi:cellulose synthase-like protein H1, partial [Tanacetum coccineum]